MKQIRRYGDFNVCPICRSRNGKYEGTGHRKIFSRISESKVCFEESCDDNENRHVHRTCNRCEGAWLDAWIEDRIPWAFRWWHRLIHWNRQMRIEEEELEDLR